jgi:hypothetical protein
MNLLQTVEELPQVTDFVLIWAAEYFVSRYFEPSIIARNILSLYNYELR